MTHLRKFWKYHIGFWTLLFILPFGETSIVDFFNSNYKYFLVEFAHVLFYYSILYSCFFSILSLYTKSKNFLLPITCFISICIIFPFISAPYHKLIFSFLDADYTLKHNLIIQDAYFARGITFFFRSFYLFGLYSVLENWDAQKKINALQKANQENALALLKSQVNPHFLMNTLNNIYSTIIRREQDGAKMILQLSDLLRHSYRTISLDKISLGEEINYLRNYIELEKIRLSQKVAITFNVQVNNLDAQIAPMLLITLVENAFKHGLSELLNEGYLNIDLALQENHLFFSVENSVSALSKEKEGNGTGLNNLKERLTLIYPQQHKLYFEEEPTKYKVVLELEI